MKVDIDQIASIIVEEMNKYSEQSARQLKTEAQKAAKKAQNELRSTSPKKYGGYSKGWTVKKTAESSTHIHTAVHNKKKYQLTHLLEKGHAKRGGGRVRAIPHIAPVEQRVIKEMKEVIKRIYGWQ